MNEQAIKMNEDTLLFATFCISGIAEYLHIDDSDAYKLLTGKGNLLDDYILKYYDTLHTQSKEYVVEEVVDLLKKEGLIQ
ncbi:MAG: DUF3791 domain-containing protein [Fusobacteriaceae bacterium]|jgi:hypothetical protein|nr:DUF3791 domain-containing protein [Fusobacteriaceae bacterium]